jgi:hypothetical protein
MSRDAYAFVWGSVPGVLTAVIGGLLLYRGQPVGSYERLGFFLVTIPMGIIFGFRQGVKQWERRHRQPVKATVVPNPLPAPPRQPNYVKIALWIIIPSVIVGTLLIWWLMWLQSLTT